MTYDALALGGMSFGGLTFIPVEAGRVIEDPNTGESMPVAPHLAVKLGRKVYCTQEDLDALMNDTRIQKLGDPPKWPPT